MAEQIPEDQIDQEPNAIALTVVIVIALVLLIGAFLWALGALNPFMDDFTSGVEPTIESTPAASPMETEVTPTEAPPSSPTPAARLDQHQEAAWSLVYSLQLEPLVAPADP